jgi:hypothetical protein
MAFYEEMKMKNRIKYISVVLFGFIAITAFCSDPIIEKRIISPLGWNLPDLSYLEKESTEVKEYPGISKKIIVETYEYKGKKGTTHYYIYNKQILKGGVVDLNNEVREWVEGLKIFKVEGEKEVICYQYDCVQGETLSSKEVQKKEAEKKKKILIGIEEGGVAGGWTSCYILDLDGDGIFESLFDRYDKDATPEEILISVLKLKLGSKNK